MVDELEFARPRPASPEGSEEPAVAVIDNDASATCSGNEKLAAARDIDSRRQRVEDYRILRLTQPRNLHQLDRAAAAGWLRRQLNATRLLGRRRSRYRTCEDERDRDHACLRHTHASALL